MSVFASPEAWCHRHKAMKEDVREIKIGAFTRLLCADCCAALLSWIREGK